MRYTRICFLYILLSLFGIGLANAETVNCTAITSVPYTILSSGVYCLTGNITTNLSGPLDFAIWIGADNVILDLNGWTLANTAGAATKSTGIYSIQKKEITVKNGTVTGFFSGISLLDTSDFKNAFGNVVEDMRLFENYGSAIGVMGRGCLIRNNLIVRTGGTSLTSSFVYALSASGKGFRIINNDISNFRGSVPTYGIYLSDFADNGFVVGNRINGADNGIAFVGSGSTGKYRDNLTMNVTTAYSGGTDAGNNN